MCLLKVECGMIDTCIEVYEMGFMISSKKKDMEIHQECCFIQNTRAFLKRSYVKNENII